MEQTLSVSPEETPIPDSRVRNPQFLAPGPSIVLDVVRFLAALMVAVGHLSQSHFSTGWPPILRDYAVASVSVFFILSGFMIRYITSVKYGDLRRYAVDRFARIYSVVLPAMGITILFDSLSAHFNHSYYYTNFVGRSERISTHFHPLQMLLAQFWFRNVVHVLLSLTMLSQSWFQDSFPLSNGPFWSLSYECVYYALFGLAIYLRGSRRILGCLVVFLLIGPTIFLMFPIWLLGCAAYDAYQDNLSRKSIKKLIAFSFLSVAGVHGSRALIAHFHLGWFKIGRIAPSMDIIAIVTVVILLPLCIAIRNVRISEKHHAVRAVRRIGAATFPLYLIHWPLFALLAALVPYPHEKLWPKLVLLAIALALSILLAGPCDSFKDYLRKVLMRRRQV
jgi:peptidoglycan/LPS O-acetylase OafA/YrhL